jgi:hypothetical protein
MKRLFAIFFLVFLAFGTAGLSAGTAAAGPANCAPNSAVMQDDRDAMAELVALTEPGRPSRLSQMSETQLACNSSCARACAARFGRCPTRECRQQFSACVRGCGC